MGFSFGTAKKRLGGAASTLHGKYKKYQADAPKRRQENIAKLKQESQIAKLKAERRKYESQHKPASSSGGFNFSGGSDFFGSSLGSYGSSHTTQKRKPQKRKKAKYKYVKVRY